MKKFINHVDQVLHESLSGLQAAHADILTVHFDPTFVRRTAPRPGKVALISGGGTGHEPLHAGFVGKGMLDAACTGQVFTSPTPDQMLAAAESVHTGAGVLFIVKNYAGDSMNFQMASEMLDIENAIVMVNDDVAVQNSTHTTGRRGVAGTLVVEKIVGAAAETGLDLAQCKAVGDRVNRATASMGVAFTSCTVPAAGRATFDIDDDEMEFGVGIHGEPGRRREPVRPAQAIVDELLDCILTDLNPAPGANVLLHVNGFGATPLMELYLLHHCAGKTLAARGVNVVRSLVGNYTTALDMAGASLTVTLMDPELLQLWDAPVRTASLNWS
ncbi:dihydroxyacetone kinase-like protein [Hydrogenophaga palleronii]|uniref:Dihydroxyacetone kinase-like protein n=1 Tax=Hydrogenophaga palleronii TaxID=65655 RepID=A0ABU1WLY7_9BURK|nr:dihydroxyacetone kinase subunit DhaK [Hydrogenophaga palleronii]MDR7150310.1 dihydroxyacetone kinase-like protein [Hydrogenophaga palleronii]